MVVRHNGYSEIERFEKVKGYWDDLRFPASAIRLSGATPPSETSYKDGQVLSFASNQDNTIYFNAQMPHGYNMEDIEFHIHMVLPVSGAGAGAENVKFDLTYSWAEIGATFPSSTTLTATRDVQNDTLDDHIYFELGSVLKTNRATGGGVGVSSMLICSLTRDVSVANDYTSAVYYVSSDFHIVSNQPGSREETSR